MSPSIESIRAADADKTRQWRLTSAQERLLVEFQNGAKLRQGNLKMTRPDGSEVRFDCRSLLPLIDRQLIWVDPQDTTYWSIR